jgi:hypothetical protein
VHFLKQTAIFAPIFKGGNRTILRAYFPGVTWGKAKAIKAYALIDPSPLVRGIDQRCVGLFPFLE